MATNLNPSDSSSSINHADLIELDIPGTPRGWSSVGTDTDSDAGDTMEIDAAPDDSGEISQAALELINAETAIARAGGFKHATSELFFEAGTKLWDIGHETAARYDAEYRALPTLADAAERHADQIAGENRRDRIVKVSELRIDDRGWLTSTDGHERKRVRTTSVSWNQLASRQATIPDPTDPEYTPHADPAVNAARAAAHGEMRGNVNAWIDQVPGDARIRVRDYQGRPEAYALVSASKRGYTPYDSDKVLAHIRAAMPADVRCRIDYDSSTTQLRADIMFQAPIDIPLAVGRTHKVGLSLRTGDRGLDALRVLAYLERMRCKNCSLTSEGNEIRRKHVGTYEELVNDVRALVGRMPELIEELRTLWMRAATEQYLDAATGKAISVPEAIARLVTLGLVPHGDLTVKAAIDAYTAAWRAEDESHSAASVIMALQRAAHETWKTDWTDEIESTASEMLYQPVYTLATPVA